MSVVIPTLDAGPGFAHRLALIRQQKGIGELELVVADSGSSDDTRSIAESAGARIVDVAPEEFNHGGTRNRAVEATSGELVLMTVQDALFLTDTTVRDLVLELEQHPRAAAVSARQVPRSDADLYGAFTVLSHYRALWPNGARRTSPSGIPATSLERRAAAAVDNVCAVIRRSAFDEIRFSEVNFAEDLDFGLRAVERGWRVALSDSVAVAHSHTRDAPYHLRRSVADRLYVAPMVGDERLSRAAHETLPVVIQSARSLLEEVEAAIAAVEAEGSPEVFASQFTALERGLRAATARSAPTGELAALDRLLASREPERAAGAPALDALRGDLLDVLAWRPLMDFVRANRGVAGVDGRDFGAKLTAAVLGRGLGDAARTGGGIDAAEAEFLVGV